MRSSHKKCAIVDIEKLKLVFSFLLASFYQSRDEKFLLLRAPITSIMSKKLLPLFQWPMKTLRGDCEKNKRKNIAIIAAKLSSRYFVIFID